MSFSCIDFSEHKDAILCMALTTDDVTLITGSKDRTFKVMSLVSGELLHSSTVQDGAINNILLNTAQSLLISGNIILLFNYIFQS